jgi:TonB family protein
MHDPWTTLSNMFLYAAQASTYSIATVIIISLVQLVGRRWIPAKWSYALWLILLVRMALPSGPDSGLSLWNLVPSNTLQLRPSALNPQIRPPGQIRASFPLLGERHVQANVEQRLRNGQRDESKAELTRPTLWRLIPVIWCGGALLLLTIIAISNLHLWNSVRKLRLVTEQPLIELLEDCKQLMKVRTVVGLVITDRVNSPSLFGFIRPRILIPTDMHSRIAMEEMRYVFLHELAHLKRGDIWIGWIVAVLQSLHWFNPLVWWAFFRMRADRELACDALALSYLGNEDNRLYGGALIRLLERFSQSQHLPAVAGILENKAQLKRRITMISQFSCPTRRVGIASAALLTILSAVLLTDAKGKPALIQGQSTVDSLKLAPIKVGGGIQQSKLIYKVDPTYPETAKAAGLSGKVVLAVTINEEGFVSEIKAVEGHPVLSDATVSAVRQWRYSTTLLNGKPVPVTTKVTVSFSAGKPVDTAYIEEPSSMRGYEILPILVPPNLSDAAAPARIHLMAEPLSTYEGRSYYTVVANIAAPVLAVDKPRLRDLANAGWPTDGIELRAPMYFFLFIEKDGTIAGIRQVQGPKIAEIDRVLANTQVESPARFGTEGVPAWVAVEIDIPTARLQSLGR